MAWTYTAEELARIVGAPLSAGTDPSVAFSAVSTDTRALRPGQAFFALSGANFDGNAFAEEAFSRGAALAVTSRPVVGPCLVVNDPLAALQQFAAHHRAQYSGPLFAITGSCGKTSAKDFTAAVLSTKFTVTKTRGNLNNDIGCPLSLLDVQPETDFAIIEMGANHMGEIAQLCAWARPTEAAVTMVGPAHLEGFGSIERVAEAKSEIVASLPPDGVFYVNTDDPRCAAMADRFPGRCIRFGRVGDIALRSLAFSASGEMELDIAPVGRMRLPLPLRAQATNVLLAVAVGWRHGVELFEEPLRQACLASTRFRLEQVGPLEVLDDSYNANPSSMRASLEALADRPSKGRRFAALGSMLELGETAPQLHAAIGEAAAECGVSALYVRGPNGCDMISGARHAGLARAELLDDHQAIARALYDEAKPGDVLLVKGSRGMRMERVLEALRALYAGERPA